MIDQTSGDSRQAAGRTLAAIVFEQIRADLVANRFKPGERLRFESLRRRYRVGLSPLREALCRLAETGLVVLIGQRGFRAAPVSIEDLHDVIATRHFLEVRALEDSIRHGDDVWEGNLVAAFHRLSKVSRRKPSTEADYAVWEREHHSFHSALLSACTSRWLQHFWRVVFAQAERYRRLAVTSGHWPRDEVTEHKRLLDAALGRDVEGACALLREHIGRSAKRLVPRVASVIEGPPAPRRAPRAARGQGKGLIGNGRTP